MITWCYWHFLSIVFVNPLVQTNGKFMVLGEEWNEE